MRHRIQIVEGRPKPPEHALQGVASVGRELFRPARGELHAGDLVVATADADALRIPLVATLLARFTACWGRTLTCLHYEQTVAYQGGCARRV